MLDRALLQTLGARPDDDALRRVMTDSLLELGDPRGEFLSLLCRRPFSGAIQRRAAKLFARHRAEWLGPVAEVSICGLLGGRVGWLTKPQPFDGSDEDHPEVWDRGFPVRLQASLSGSTRGAAAWLTVREVVLFPGAGVPLELEVETTPNLRAVRVLEERWGQAPVHGYAEVVGAFLRSVGRGALLEAQLEWPLPRLMPPFIAIG